MDEQMFTDRMNWKHMKELHKAVSDESLTLKVFKNISGVSAHHWVMLQAWVPHFKVIQVKFS